MSDRATGMAPSRVVAVLGPTNTGKTHLAVERMLGHASGMIGLPLRLLAREIYDRIVKRRGAAAVALVTGEEKIVPPRAHYFVCTVEAMPMERQVEFLAVDEIQLVADPERGHVFTQRLLHARGRFETMFLGAGTMAPLMRALVPDVEIVQRERLSTLSYAGSKKLTRLPRRSAIVAFSTEQVVHGVEVQPGVPPLGRLDGVEAMLDHLFDQVRVQLLRLARDAESAVPQMPPGAARDLADLVGVQPAGAAAVELAQAREGDMVDLHVQPHADGVGGHQEVHLARLEQLDLGVAGARAQAAHDHGGPAPLAADQLGDGVDLLGREGDDGAAPGQAGQLLGPGIAQR